MTQFLPELFLIQMCACFFNTGLIWTIQMVHYPAFVYIDKNRFREFHIMHSRRITWVVGPMMLVELASALMLALSGQLFWIVNACGVVLLFALTAFVSVPLHNRLAKGFDAGAVQKLVATNWYRTGLWTLRFLALAYLLSLPARG